jgi:hypothetical protein
VKSPNKRIKDYIHTGKDLKKNKNYDDGGAGI